MFSVDKSSLTKNIEQNLRIAFGEANVAGKGTFDVKIIFTVVKDGTLKDFVPLANFKYGLEREVMQLLKKGTKWIAAKRNGSFNNSIREQNQVFKVPAF